MKDVDVDEDTGNGFDDTRGPFRGGKKARTPGLWAFVICIGGVSVGMVGFAVYHYTHASIHSAATKPEHVNNLPKYKFSEKPDFPAQTAPAGKPDNPASAPVKLEKEDALPDGSGDGQQHGKKREPTLAEQAMARRLGHDFDDMKGETNTSTATKPAPDGYQNSPDSDGLNTRLHAKYDAPAKAVMLKNQDFLVTRGTVISCGTLGELDTTQPGMISCQVTRDVWSVNGKVRLIDKGAFVDGQVASGIRFGQNKVFVVWTRLKNPDGSIVDLASPATGPLGSAGIKGQVDNHWGERFGDAIAISFITDAFQTMVQSVSNLAAKKGTSSISMSETQNSGQQMGQQALMQKMNIPPTLYDYQGDAVNIFIARDLDFSGVYKLSDE